MGLKLRVLVGALKDTASYGKAALLSPPAAAPSAAASAAAARLAVLHATPHHPRSSPPPARRLEALLAFGRGSRLAAAALVRALAARLRSTGDPAVALKALLALHLLLSRGAFILRDQLPPILLRHPSSGHNPLALSSFPLGSSPSSWALAAWVRWFARLLELLLLLPPNPPAPSDPDRLASLLNRDLLAELDPLVAVAEEIRRAPDPASSPLLHNMLIRETIRVAEEDRAAAEREIGARVRELRERVDSLGFADSVELACLLKRLDGGGADRKRAAVADDPFWAEVAELRERVEGAVAAKGEEERRRVRSRGLAISESARIVVRVESELGAAPVRFGSARWLQR